MSRLFRWWGLLFGWLVVGFVGGVVVVQVLPSA